MSNETISIDLLRKKPRRSSGKLTLAVAKRLQAASEKAQLLWAEVKQDITDIKKVERYARQLRRCDRLQSLLERGVV